MIQWQGCLMLLPALSKNASRSDNKWPSMNTDMQRQAIIRAVQVMGKGEEIGWDTKIAPPSDPLLPPIFKSLTKASLCKELFWTFQNGHWAIAVVYDGKCCIAMVGKVWCSYHSIMLHCQLHSTASSCSKWPLELLLCCILGNILSLPLP